MRFFPRLSTVRGSIFRPVIGISMAVIALQSASAMEGTAVFADPSKIVAVGGSITEIVYALGEEKASGGSRFHQPVPKGGA